MNIDKRNAAILQDRLESKGTLDEIGEHYHLSGSRVHQITQPFFSKLPASVKHTSRVRRLVLTKSDIALKFGIPERRLEIRV